MTNELELELHTKRCGDDAWNFASYQLGGLVNTSSFPLKPWEGLLFRRKTVSGVSSLHVWFIRTKPDRHILTCHAIGSSASVTN